jgi:molecular chaperone DnaJ
MNKNYYDILGVQKNASADDIKKSYRKLAVKLHPDTNKNKNTAEDDFKSLNEAYSILSDPDKRAAYDRFGSAAFSSNKQQRHNNFNFHNVFNEHFNDEMFNSFFGGTFNQQKTYAPSRSTNGSTINLHKEITLTEAYNGCIKDVTYTNNIHCTICRGTGSSRAEKATHCMNCNGAGVTNFIDNNRKIRAQTCKSCNGLGTVVEYPCRACHGQGITSQNVTRKLTIPKGIYDGTQIRIKAQGNAGPRNGTIGDLIVTVVIHDTDHITQYIRDNDDLYKEIEVSYASAVLGREHSFKHIDDSVITVNIPKGIKDNQKIRIKNKGMPIINTENNGDLFLRVHIIIPTNLNDNQIKLLEQFEQSLTTNKTTYE